MAEHKSASALAYKQEQERLREQGREAAEHYASPLQVALAEGAFDLPPEEAARRRAIELVESLAREEAATRRRIPSELKGDRAQHQAMYDKAFHAEKARRAWPNVYKPHTTRRRP